MLLGNSALNENLLASSQWMKVFPVMSRNKYCWWAEWKDYKDSVGSQNGHRWCQQLHPCLLHLHLLLLHYWPWHSPHLLFQLPQPLGTRSHAHFNTPSFPQGEKLTTAFRLQLLWLIYALFAFCVFHSLQLQCPSLHLWHMLPVLLLILFIRSDICIYLWLKSKLLALQWKCFFFLIFC